MRKIQLLLIERNANMFKHTELVVSMRYIEYLNLKGNGEAFSLKVEDKS